MFKFLSRGFIVFLIVFSFIGDGNQRAEASKKMQCKITIDAKKHDAVNTGNFAFATGDKGCERIYGDWQDSWDWFVLRGMQDVGGFSGVEAQVFVTRTQELHVTLVDKKGKVTKPLPKGTHMGTCAVTVDKTKPYTSTEWAVSKEKGVVKGTKDLCDRAWAHLGGSGAVGVYKNVDIYGNKYTVEVTHIHEDGTVEKPGQKEKERLENLKPYEFIDVRDNNPHYIGIVNWSKIGVINGYKRKDGFSEYRPDASISRQHVAVLLDRVFDLPEMSRDEVRDILSNYKDVSESHEYAKEIASTYKAGIFSGSGGYFMGDSDINREQMATVLVNAFKLDEGRFTEIGLNRDLSYVSPVHQESVRRLMRLGISMEFDLDVKNSYRPFENVTRGQFATFLFRSHKAKKYQSWFQQKVEYRDEGFRISR